MVSSSIHAVSPQNFFASLSAGLVFLSGTSFRPYLDSLLSASSFDSPRAESLPSAFRASACGRL